MGIIRSSAVAEVPNVYPVLGKIQREQLLDPGGMNGWMERLTYKANYESLLLEYISAVLCSVTRFQNEPR